MNYPTGPSGANDQASFFRRMLECLKRSRPIAGVGLRAEETPCGVILSVTGGAGGVGGSGSPVYMFAITQLTGKDYFKAKFWNGATLGQEVAIAKPPRLRPSITREYFDDVAFTYALLTRSPYDPFGDNNRTANDGTDSEFQVLFPRYVTLNYLGLTVPDHPGCQAIIFAAKSQNETGVSTVDGARVEWIELSPARVWARRYLQQ